MSDTDDARLEALCLITQMAVNEIARLPQMLHIPAYAGFISAVELLGIPLEEMRAAVQVVSLDLLMLAPAAQR